MIKMNPKRVDATWWAGWFGIKDLARCTAPELKKAMRSTFAAYHPDKCDGDKACCHDLSLYIVAVYDLLEPLCAPCPA